MLIASCMLGSDAFYSGKIACVCLLALCIAEKRCEGIFSEEEHEARVVVVVLLGHWAMWFSPVTACFRGCQVTRAHTSSAHTAVRMLLGCSVPVGRAGCESAGRPAARGMQGTA